MRLTSPSECSSGRPSECYRPKSASAGCDMDDAEYGDEEEEDYACPLMYGDAMDAVSEEDGDGHPGFGLYQIFP